MTRIYPPVTRKSAVWLEAVSAGKPRRALSVLSVTMTSSWSKSRLRRIQHSRCISMRMTTRTRQGKAKKEMLMLIKSRLSTPTSRCNVCMSRTRKLCRRLPNLHSTITWKIRANHSQRWVSTSLFRSRCVMTMKGGIWTQTILSWLSTRWTWMLHKRAQELINSSRW